MNGELYGFSQPLLQLIRPLIDTPVRFSLGADLGGCDIDLLGTRRPFYLNASIVSVGTYIT